ncbi:hypothetical protein [Photobacterium leiognathi]|uniref:hypothetical protein n=1 Tax=Photobacterium leiognathi TaxID=553611 RepID=UPI002734C13A|nr:hypothetical protein [Photobacterium leiognathi]
MKLIRNMKDTLLNAGEASKEICQAAESSIDIFIESEVLAEIPFVEYVFSIKNAVDKYQVAKVKRNYANFIKSASNMNTEEALYFTNQIFANTEQAEEAAETIFDIITNSERPIKAEILGRLCVSFAQGKIELDEFNSLMHITCAATIPALKAMQGLMTLYNNQVRTYYQRSKPYIAQLSSIGLAISSSNSNGWELTEFGIQLAVYGFGFTLYQPNGELYDMSEEVNGSNEFLIFEGNEADT